MMPIAFFIATALICLLIYFTRNVLLNHLMVFLHLALLSGLTVRLMDAKAGQSAFFEADQLSLIFLLVLIAVTFVSAIHYMNYAAHRAISSRNIALHNAGTVFFTGAITGVLIADHFGILWAFMEATTIGAAVLIYHDRDKAALEASWKYLFVCSIGIAIAFAGILFLGLASRDTGISELSFQLVRDGAGNMNPVLLKACFLLVLTGFSIKMGLVPLFNVDIDAKDASPSPVGASLSTVLMNAGFVAVFRFYEAFAGTSIHSWMNHVLLIAGVLSLFFAAVYMLKVGNVKRLLAYSSMEHAGLVIIAFSFGGIGYVAAILHLILHSLIKASLFLQVSQMHRIYKSKLDEDIGNYVRVNPFGGFIMILGFLGIMAIPPSGLFVSEWLMFNSIFSHELFWVGIIIMILLLLIIFGFSVRLLGILYTPRKQIEVKKEEIMTWESGLQLVMLGSVFFIGIYQPVVLTEMITSAISTLPDTVINIR